MTRTTEHARQQIRSCAVFDPAAASDAAWAAADTLYIAADALSIPELRQAADSYARATRVPYVRFPPRSRLGTSLRGAARLLSLTGYHYVPGRTALITSLAGLAEAVAELREAQQRAVQAAAARRAAEQLHAALSPRPTGPRPFRPRSVAVVIASECAAPPAPERQPATQPARPSHRPRHSASPSIRRGRSR